jgi:hypothetical protein
MRVCLIDGVHARRDNVVGFDKPADGSDGEDQESFLRRQFRGGCQVQGDAYGSGGRRFGRLLKR